MNKILLTSASVFGVLGLICVASADITANESSPDCDNTTLGVESGATNLEAQWQANTITLKWYNNDTQFTPTNNAASGECTYDGALTVPSDTLSKTGYTFDGWKVKVAPQRTLVNSCNSILNEQDCNNSYFVIPHCINGEDLNVGCGWVNNSCREKTTTPCSGGTND